MKKWLDINAKKPEDAKVLILGIPFDGGTSQEVAPPLDVNDITSWAAVRIIEEVLSYADQNL